MDTFPQMIGFTLEDRMVPTAVDPDRCQRHACPADRGHSTARQLSGTWLLLARYPMLALLFTMANAAAAQTSGKLRLQIDPETSYSYRLDHTYTMQQDELELLEGPHHFSFWAPERRVVDTTITISGGGSQQFQMRLPFSTEYLIYQRDLKAYDKEMRKMHLLPAVATGGALLYTAVKYGQMKKAHDQLDEDRTAYDEAAVPYSIEVLKEQTIPAHRDEFDKARTHYQVAMGITVLFAGATAYLYVRAAKRPKPVFIDSEKLRFEGLSWMPGPNGGEWMGGLTWNFQR